MDDPGPAGLTVRAAVAADLPALDEAIPTGRNDVHRAFLAHQSAGAAAMKKTFR